MSLERPEVTPQKIRDHFENRRNYLEVLDRELQTLGNVLLTLVPTGLEAFKKEAFHDMKKWLTDLHANGSLGNSLKIKDPEEYGFEDMEDAKTKMETLKNAWAGIIDVEISTENYVSICLKLAR